jgi:hypothetical protein
MLPGKEASAKTLTAYSANTSLRQPTCLCFPKNSSIKIVWKLNTRPRKTLGWKAPAELFLPEGTFDFADYRSKHRRGGARQSGNRASLV